MPLGKRKTLVKDQLKTFEELHSSFEDDWLFILFFQLSSAPDDETKNVWEDTLPMTTHLNYLDKRFKKWKELYRVGWEELRVHVMKCSSTLSHITHGSFYFSAPEGEQSPSITPSNTTTSFININNPSRHNNADKNNEYSISLPRLSPTTPHANTNSSPSSFSRSPTTGATISSSSSSSNDKPAIQIQPVESWINFVSAPKTNFGIEDDSEWHGTSKSTLIKAMNSINDKRRQLSRISISLDNKFKAVKDIIERVAKSMNGSRNLHFLLQWLAIKNRLCTMTKKERDDKTLDLLRQVVLAFRDDYTTGIRILGELTHEKAKLESAVAEAEKNKDIILLANTKNEWKAVQKEKKAANGWQKVKISKYRRTQRSQSLISVTRITKRPVSA